MLGDFSLDDDAPKGGQSSVGGSDIIIVTTITSAQIQFDFLRHLFLNLFNLLIEQLADPEIADF